ncbi:hypothetical protein [Planctomycetes bacterium TBK1r]
MRFETLESRRLLASWMSVLPSELRFASVAQASSGGNLCLAYVSADVIGTAKITPSSTSEVDLIPIEPQPEFRSPFDVTDAVFREDGLFEMVGSAVTDRSLRGGNGEPTSWTEEVPNALGLDSTIAGNAGAFHAVHRDGRSVKTICNRSFTSRGKPRRYRWVNTTPSAPRWT